MNERVANGDGSNPHDFNWQRLNPWRWQQLKSTRLQWQKESALLEESDNYRAPLLLSSDPTLHQTLHSLAESIIPFDVLNKCICGKILTYIWQDQTTNKVFLYLKSDLLESISTKDFNFCSFLFLEHNLRENLAVHLNLD